MNALIANFKMSLSHEFLNVINDGIIGHDLVMA